MTDVFKKLFCLFPDTHMPLSAIIFANNLPVSALIGTDAAEQTFSLHAVQMIFNAVLG